MELQDYLQLNKRFTRMEQLVDVWAIDYQMEKLVPLVEHGFEYEDILNFIQTRFDKFVHGGKLDEILEQNKLNNK